jgi:hypothetical protein
MSSSINADESWDKTTAEVGLPRRRRYNMFVALASHEMQDSVTVTHATLEESISVLVKPGERVVSVAMLVPLGEEPFLHIPAAVQIAHDHWEKHFGTPIPQTEATFVLTFSSDLVHVQLYGPPAANLPF